MASNLRKTQTSLKSIILLAKNVNHMSSFFTEIVGLKLVHMMPNGEFAELADQHNFRL